jgi:DNA-binding HxlR family transcriptional regulator
MLLTCVSASGAAIMVRLAPARAEEGTFLSQSHIDVSVLAGQACPVAEVIDQVSGRWTLGILTAAAQGPVRFAELERCIRGISRRMLTLKLRQLERNGLLTRTVYPAVPPRVEYTLTEIAVELLSTLQGLTSWAVRHRGTVTAARAAYDSQHGAPPG